MTPTPPPTPDDKLLPCPFCGGKASIERYGDHRQSTIYKCDDCSCSLETGEEWSHGKRWNTRAALAPTQPTVWHDGAPPKPWRDEWFIAVTTYGDRVVLTSLPEEYAYDFKTADETYIKADKIKKWMQFPDSEYIAPSPTPSPDDAAVLDAYFWARYNDGRNERGGDKNAPTLGQARAAVLARMDRRAKPLTWDTLICTGCLHVGDKPPPPALSCCPERKPVKLAQLCEDRRAVIEACAEIADAELPRTLATPSLIGQDAACRAIAAAIRALKGGENV